MSRPAPPSLGFSWPRRTFALAVSMGAVWTTFGLSAWSPLTLTPPKQAPAGGATKTELLKAQPFDRITLLDNKVLVVEPVSPRPLPPPPTGEPTKKTKAFTKQDVLEQQEAERQVIRLTEGDFRDFAVKKVSIKSVEYFEDMLLAEGDRQLRDGNHAKAFEYYLAVRERSPKWKGLDERLDKLLFEEGNSAIVRGDSERGLRLLRELLARKPDFPNLGDRVARAYSDRINKALEKGLYAEGRAALHELETITPNHVLAKEARNKYVTRAQNLADRATKKQGGDQLADLSEALRIWPELDSAASKFTEAFASQPTLEVAVLDVPRAKADDRDPSPGFGPWVRTRAEARLTPIVYLPILAKDEETISRDQVTGQLATDLEITDIGRTLVLRLRPDVRWSDNSRPVSSLDLARTLGDRAVPRSPSYVARWANMLERLDATDNERVTIRLSRPILKPEAWLVVPVGPAHAGRDGLVPTPEGRQTVGNGPFRVAELTKGSARFRAAAPAEPGSRKLRFVREVRVANANAAVSALIRGEASLLEHVPPERLPELAQDPTIKIGRYSHPSMHRLVLDGRNQVLRNRSVRRALSYAIDRRALLEETVLRRTPDERNRLADGPFPADSYANAPNVRPFEHDPLMAKMLLAAGRKEMGNDPLRLRFEYPAVPEAQATAPKIAEMFREAGKVGDQYTLTIDLIERAPDDFERELRAGRRFDIAYMIDRVNEPALQAGLLLCPGYDAPPQTDALAAVPSPRILQLLLQLERASDAPAAKELLQEIDREARDELPVLPLWQLDEYYAWRDRLTGPLAQADSLYQGIETWEIKPWFARDPWSSSPAPTPAPPPAPSP